MPSGSAAWSTGSSGTCPATRSTTDASTNQMSQSIVAGRYARALYDGAVSDGAVDRVDADVSLLDSSLRASPELGRFFVSPIVSRDRKMKVTEALFEERVCNTTVRFLRLLVSKRREHLLGAVLGSYRGLRDAQLGILEAHATVALEATDADQEGLGAALKAHFGKDVPLTVDVDGDLVGGVLIQVGDTVYDGSVAGRLKSLRKAAIEKTTQVVKQSLERFEAVS